MAMTRATERTIALPMYDEAAPDNLKSGLTPTVVVSKDGGAFAVAINAAAEIGTTGVYALVLTAAEMDADLVTVKVTASGACDQMLALVTDPAAPDLSNLDVAVSSRLAAADYTEPPSAEATADEVRAELAPELARLDADVSDAVAAPALALTAYDPPTRAEATADKEAVLAAVAALPDDADVESVLEAVAGVAEQAAAIRDKTDTLGGSGSVAWSYALTSSVDGAPIADAEVWVTTDEAGDHVVASGRTTAAGTVAFQLEPGTYYVWRRKAGFNFDNPDAEVVS